MDFDFVDNAGDVAGEVASGIYMVHASVTFTLSANLANLTLTGATAIDGTGNAKNNIISGTGNAKASVITGIGTDNVLPGSCRH